MFNLLIILLLLFPALSYAELQTIEHTIQQPFAGSQSPDDARIAAISRAKREALERVGTYLESETIVKDAALEKDEIVSLTAGIAKAEVVSQRNYTEDGIFWIEVKVKVQLDTNDANASLKRLLEEKSNLRQLNLSREREKELLLKIAKYAEIVKGKGKGKVDKQLIDEFAQTTKSLKAVDCFDKGNNLIIQDFHKNAKQAIEYYTTAIRYDQNLAEAYINRGYIYGLLKLNANAIDDFNKAILINPKSSYAYNNRGNVYRNIKEYQKALQD